MLAWGEGLFNCFGPMNDRTVASFPVLEELMAYATNEAVPENLKPGSWAAGIHDAVARGEVPAQAALAKRIQRFAILEVEPLLNNVLRGFKTLRVAAC